MMRSKIERKEERGNHACSSMILILYPTWSSLSFLVLNVNTVKASQFFINIVKFLPIIYSKIFNFLFSIGVCVRGHA